ncbi:hypothetical protein AAC978_06315 [Desulfitobacterium sp. THU1]
MVWRRKCSVDIFVDAESTDECLPAEDFATETSALALERLSGADV